MVEGGSHTLVEVESSATQNPALQMSNSIDDESDVVADRTCTVKLTYYKVIGSQLNLPIEFAEFLERQSFHSPIIRGLADSRSCCVIRNKNRKSVKIGKGWRRLCVKNGFYLVDALQFKFINDYCNVVDVRKID
ncbi:hypothetical protein Fmac_031635 [Flemingia macrophylla]|uniref:TF-B3 domain-containing protein n=1 Tax=Flemingia macrophylla TaxID=520843 RepID=A0ABD1L2L5_9FABA